MNKNVLSFIVATVVVIGVIVVALQFVLPQWLKTAVYQPTAIEAAIAACQNAYSSTINNTLPQWTTNSPPAYKTARIAAGQASTVAGTLYAQTHTNLLGSSIYSPGFNFDASRALHTTFVAKLTILSPALLNTYQKDLDTAYSEYLTCEGKARSPNQNPNTSPNNPAPATMPVTINKFLLNSAKDTSVPIANTPPTIKLEWATTNATNCAGQEKGVAWAAGQISPWKKVQNTDGTLTFLTPNTATTPVTYAFTLICGDGTQNNAQDVSLTIN